MEMIYHVHLTKTDFENIKHLQLSRVVFMHLLMLSPEKILILKIMTVGGGLNENCMDGTRWKFRISEERNVWSIQRNKQTHKHTLTNHLE